MTPERTYGINVKLGNWAEEQHLEEDKKKEYLDKKERGELTCQKVDFLKDNILRPVNLSVTNDGGLHFGDVIMLVNMGGENRERSAVSINADINSLSRTPSACIQTPCGVSAGGGVQPCTRNAFVITSVDGSREGSKLHFDQTFALKTTSGFARGLYLTSDQKGFQKYSKKSHLQEVNLDEDGSFCSWWRIVHYDPQERLEFEGLPVPAYVKVVILHCKTNQALAALGEHVLWTAYGKEYEVAAHTFLDSHKAEEDKNHWMLCTADPLEGGLLLLHHQESATNYKEPTQANPE